MREYNKPNGKSEQRKLTNLLPSRPSNNQDEARKTREGWRARREELNIPGTMVTVTTMTPRYLRRTVCSHLVNSLAPSQVSQSRSKKLSSMRDPIGLGARVAQVPGMQIVFVTANLVAWDGASRRSA